MELFVDVGAVQPPVHTLIAIHGPLALPAEGCHALD